MSFKFLRGKDINLVELSTLQLASLRITGNNHVNNEYCFQFDDDEPFVFGSGSENLTLTISPTEGGNISFNHNGRTFKIFAREGQ